MSGDTVAIEATSAANPAAIVRVGISRLVVVAKAESTGETHPALGLLVTDERILREFTAEGPSLDPVKFVKDNRRHFGSAHRLLEPGGKRRGVLL